MKSLEDLVERVKMGAVLILTNYTVNNWKREDSRLNLPQRVLAYEPNWRMLRVQTKGDESMLINLPDNSDKYDKLVFVEDGFEVTRGRFFYAYSMPLISNFEKEEALAL